MAKVKKPRLELDYRGTPKGWRSIGELQAHHRYVEGIRADGTTGTLYRDGDGFTNGLKAEPGAIYAYPTDEFIGWQPRETLEEMVKARAAA